MFKYFEDNKLHLSAITGSSPKDSSLIAGSTFRLQVDLRETCPDSTVVSDFYYVS